MTDQIAELIKNLVWVPLIAYLVHCIYQYAMKRLEYETPRMKIFEQDIDKLNKIVFGTGLPGTTIRLENSDETQD